MPLKTCEFADVKELLLLQEAPYQTPSALNPALFGDLLVVCPTVPLCLLEGTIASSPQSDS